MTFTVGFEGSLIFRHFAAGRTCDWGIGVQGAHMPTRIAHTSKQFSTNSTLNAFIFLGTMSIFENGKIE